MTKDWKKYRYSFSPQRFFLRVSVLSCPFFHSFLRRMAPLLKRKPSRRKWIVTLFFAGIFYGTAAHSKDFLLGRENLPKILRFHLNNLSEGDRILLPEGEFFFERTLNFIGRKVSILGGGSGVTILNFSSQKLGAQGINARGYDIELSGFSVVAATGDGVVVRDSDVVKINDLKISWAEGESDKKGGYGIYPVSSRRVTVSHCAVSGALEAGIYLGQVAGGEILRNQLSKNAVGIHVENSKNVAVKNNSLERNSIGILVAAVPSLPIKATSDIVIKGNTVSENNYKNISSRGNLASKLGSGVGISIIAADRVSIIENQLKRHRSSDISAVSYFEIQSDVSDSYYNPYIHQLTIRDNTWSGKAGSRSVDRKNIHWDGRVQNGALDNPSFTDVICIDEKNPITVQIGSGKPRVVAHDVCLPE